VLRAGEIEPCAARAPMTKSHKPDMGEASRLTAQKAQQRPRTREDLLCASLTTAAPARASPLRQPVHQKPSGCWPGIREQKWGRHETTTSEPGPSAVVFLRGEGICTSGGRQVIDTARGAGLTRVALKTARRPAGRQARAASPHVQPATPALRVGSLPRVQGAHEDDGNHARPHGDRDAVHHERYV
jgi:hypothetical protein